MTILADESVDQQIVDRLRDDGHHVFAISEMEPGIPDDAVLKQARDQDALLITADKDFGEMVFRQRLLTSGVILLRLSGISAFSKATLVSSALREHGTELRETFTVVSPGLTRVRHRF